MRTTCFFWVLAMVGLAGIVAGAGQVEKIARSPGYEVEELDEKGGGAKTGGREALVLFGPEANRLHGWSHIVDHPETFSHARCEKEAYAVDETCLGAEDGRAVFHTILLKKLGDWDQQHINGIEPLFADAPLRLGQARAIVIELRIDSARSRIPTVAEIEGLYSHFLTAEQRVALDNGRAHLGISVFEAGFNNHDGRALNATVLVEIDPARQFDRWLRVTIPLETMAFYFEKNYAQTPAARADNLERRLVGLRINPETRTSLVVRNFMGGAFGPQVPERYKEISLTIRRLEIERATE